MDLLKVAEEVAKLVDAKADFNKMLFNVLQTKDKNKLIEILVEDAAYDIQLMGRLTHILGLDPTPPLSDITTENIKKKMFKILELSD